MYRVSGPNLIIFIPVTIIGIVIVTLIPHYIGVSRILSFTSLIIGELGLSFIPVLAFYQKATITQVLLLASIFFLNTILICFSVWGIHTIGFTPKFAFLWKDNQFYINTYAVFAANIFSFINLLLCFKLIYDEELAKEQHTKKKSIRERHGFGFRSPLLRRPMFEDFTRTASTRKSTQSPRTTSTTKEEEALFDEEIEKSFEFEPDIETESDNLPEESQGGLFAKDEPESSDLPEFFDEETEQQKKKNNPTTEDPFKSSISTSTHYETKTGPSRTKTMTPITPPGDIKEDLSAIFEQYSSLNAIKKLTGRKTTEQRTYSKKEKYKKPYVLPHDTEDISVEIEHAGDVHEASFRQISGKETIEEIKSDLKEEINKEILSKLEEKTSQIKESISKTELLQDEIIKNIKNVKEELLNNLREEIKGKIEEKDDIKKIEIIQEQLKQEINKELSDKLDEKTIRIEETIKKSEALKEEIIQSIKGIKEELLINLKEEIKTRLEGKQLDESNETKNLEAVQEELKKEIQNELVQKFNEQTLNMEESLKKTEALKEDIVQSIKSIKEELLENLRQEMISIASPLRQITEEITTKEEKIEIDSTLLENISKEQKVSGLILLNENGDILFETWKKGKEYKADNINNLSLANYFKGIENNISKTNQSSLHNALLEAENGILFLAKLKNKLLTVYTEDKGEVFSGKILRAISELNDNL